MKMTAITTWPIEPGLLALTQQGYGDPSDLPSTASQSLRAPTEPASGSTLGDSLVVVAEGEGDLPRGIGAPATRALAGAGYTTLDQLAGVPAKELTALHGFGPKALRLIQEALERQGQTLG
jgi:hypothetical protein